MEFIAWTEDKINEVVDLWNKHHKDTFPMRHDLMKQNSIDHAHVVKDASWMACNESGEVVGFVVGKSDEGIGWIQTLIVDLDYRGIGVGTEMLKLAENALKKQGVSKVILGKDRYHYFPGIPDQLKYMGDFAEKHGYQRDGREHDLMGLFPDGVDLPKVQDITFKLLSYKEKDEMLQFLNDYFPGRWEEEAEDYFMSGGTGREFVVMKKAGNIIGFARINDQHSPVIFQNTYWSPLFKDAVGGIGPLGIADHERGNRYGLHIVNAAKYFLSERGVNRMIIDWTTLVRFYERLGFSVWRSYDTYSKQVES